MSNPQVGWVIVTECGQIMMHTVRETAEQCELLGVDIWSFSGWEQAKKAGTHVTSCQIVLSREDSLATK